MNGVSMGEQQIDFDSRRELNLNSTKIEPRPLPALARLGLIAHV